MKKILIICLIAIAILFTGKTSGQGFVTTVEGEAFSALFGSQCTLWLESGDEIQGKLQSATISSGGLNKITIKLESGEKVKYTPEQVISLRIKAS
jgi:hypothetical protein